MEDELRYRELRSCDMRKNLRYREESCDMDKYELR